MTLFEVVMPDVGMRYLLGKQSVGVAAEILRLRVEKVSNKERLVSYQRDSSPLYAWSG